MDYERDMWLLDLISFAVAESGYDDALKKELYTFTQRLSQMVKDWYR